VLKATLTYDKGTIVIHGLAHLPFAMLDPRTNVLRALPLYYSSIIEYLKQSGVEYSDHVFSEETMMLSSSLLPSSPLSLRDYQERAIDNWMRAGLRGCIVLPTGSGKTIIGIRAIEKANSASLVVVPITKWFAGMLFAEPYHLHVHTFSICQNGIISFVITRRIKLTNKDRSTWMLI
jgi:hypothetical protein